MQVEIDFEVFKELTARLEHEHESYNDVIRRLLGLTAVEITLPAGIVEPHGVPAVMQGLQGQTGGVWFSNVFFPDGTSFRATYKGKTYRASIRNSQWLDELGFQRSSPSDAASAISGTNVNGWKFWSARRPFDEDWQRMDALKS